QGSRALRHNATPVKRSAAMIPAPVVQARNTRNATASKNSAQSRFAERAQILHTANRLTARLLSSNDCWRRWRQRSDPAQRSDVALSTDQKAAHNSESNIRKD